MTASADPLGPDPDLKSTAYLVFDSESVPDGRLINKLKYPGENLTDAEAVARAQSEARDQSWNQSDFIPVTFQFPVAICVIRVDRDYRLRNISCLDAPRFETRAIVEKFWKGVNDLWELQRKANVGLAQFVSFNGRSFDMALLEMAAYRYGCVLGPHYFKTSRKRYELYHIDLLEWLSNFGAWRVTGGLNLLSKLLGKPGKMETSGNQVYALYQEGKRQAINDYCTCDTLDTYFVFLRSRLLLGEISLEHEQQLVQEAKAYLEIKKAEWPALEQYLDRWGDWQPWP